MNKNKTKTTARIVNNATYTEWKISKKKTFWLKQITTIWQQMNKNELFQFQRCAVCHSLVRIEILRKLRPWNTTNHKLHGVAQTKHRREANKNQCEKKPAMNKWLFFFEFVEFQACLYAAHESQALATSDRHSLYSPFSLFLCFLSLLLFISLLSFAFSSVIMISRTHFRPVRPTQSKKFVCISAKKNCHLFAFCHHYNAFWWSFVSFPYQIYYNSPFAALSLLLQYKKKTLSKFVVSDNCRLENNIFCLH